MQSLKRKLTSSVPLDGTDQKNQKKPKTRTKFPRKKYWKFDFGDPTIYRDDVWSF